MRINKINFIIFISLFINNLVAFPLIIINILKKRESILLIALFISIFAFFFEFNNGVSDLDRYYSLYLGSENERKIFFDYQKDIYAEYLMKFLLYFGLSKNFIGMISAFITYYFLFKVLNLNLNKKLTKFEYLSIYILYFLSIPFVGYTGVRFWPALSIMLYGLMLKLKNKDKKWIVYSVLSLGIHSSMLLPLILAICVFYFNPIKSIKKLKLFILISYLIGQIISPENLFKFITFINSLGYIYIPKSYILGIWGAGAQNRYETKLSLLFQSHVFPMLFLLIIIFYILKYLKYNLLDFYIGYFIMFYLLFIKYEILTLRYGALVFLLIINSILIKNINRKWIIISLIIIYSILGRLVEIRRYNESIKNSFYNPVKVSITGIILEEK